jgi:hypothetical protein
MPMLQIMLFSLMFKVDSAGFCVYSLYAWNHVMFDRQRYMYPIDMCCTGQ